MEVFYILFLLGTKSLKSRVPFTRLMPLDLEAAFSTGRLDLCLGFTITYSWEEADLHTQDVLGIL